MKKKTSPKTKAMTPLAAPEVVSEAQTETLLGELRGLIEAARV